VKLALVLTTLFIGGLVAVVTAQPPAVEVPLSPADVVALAAADAATLAPSVQVQARWLSLHNLPAASRAEAAQILGGHLNSLSREPDVVRPVPVARGMLLRISTEDYGSAFAVAWEKLADQEPYFHVTTLSATEDEYEEVTVEFGFWVTPAGEKYTGRKRAEKDTWERTRLEKERRKKPKVKTGRLAPWLLRTPKEKAALEYLIGVTESDSPIITAEWFVVQTAIQDQRKPGYYDFLGVKDEATFQRLVGYTERDIDPSFLREVRESVAVSGVTLQPRAIERKEKVGGALWRTRDIRVAKDKSNPLRVLDDKLVFDATEQYGHLSNGLWAMFLGNAKGERQDSAPDFIASDSTAPHNDRRVHIYLSCARCHSASGLQEIDGWVRGVLNAPPNFLAAADIKEAKRLRQQYVRRLEPHLVADRKRYSDALLEATGGLTPEKYASGLALLWKTQAEDAVTVDRAARDLGCSVKELQDALAAQGAAVDPTLSAFRLPKPRPISLGSWQESYALAQLAIGGKVLPILKK
jgi:hypothetical protein